MYYLFIPRHLSFLVKFFFESYQNAVVDQIWSSCGATTDPRAHSFPFFFSVEVKWEIEIVGSDDEEEKRCCFMLFSSLEEFGVG